MSPPELRPVTAAVILAAGEGSRLRPACGDLPKPLVEVGGQALLHRSVALLQAAGVPRVVVVVAPGDAALPAALAARPGPQDLRPQVVVNPRARTAGSLASLLAGAQGLDGDLLLLEGDLLYEARALGEALALAGTGLLVSVDSGVGDEVWVEAAGSRLRALDKSRAALRAVTGELVGISRLTPGALDALRRLDEARPGLDYEDGLVAIGPEVPVEVRVCPGLAWTEVDDAAQLERARELVWPRIAAAEA